MDFDKIHFTSLTDVGVRRSHNQDALAVLTAADEATWRERGHFFLVADGMGAHAVGELASKLAAELIPHGYAKHAAQGAPEALRRAFEQANAAINERGEQNPEFEGMGTTGTALLLRSDGAWIAHVGDSRAYRIRAGHIEQISYDHSLQWELARRQRVKPEQIQGIERNVIVRSLGPDPTVQIDIEGPHPIQPGDMYLLCSDGLSGQLSDQEMGTIVSALPHEQAVRLLVDLANLRGGPDNITVILVRTPVPPYASPSSLVPSPSPWPWPARLTWYNIALALGAGLAALSLLLLALTFWLDIHAAYYTATFFVALATLSAGLYGTYQAHQRDLWLADQASRHRPPRVYRRTPCALDAALFERLADESSVFLDRARESGWEADWPSYRRQCDSARGCFERGDLAAAFLEQCRALAALGEAMRRRQNKEEVFQPLW